MGTPRTAKSSFSVPPSFAATWSVKGESWRAKPGSFDSFQIRAMNLAFRALLAWKSRQYRRTGQVDVFARPWITDLVEARYF